MPLEPALLGVAFPVDPGLHVVEVRPVGAKGRRLMKHAKVGDKLQDGQHHPGAATGSPVLNDAIGYLECRITGWIQGGDHEVALGEIVAAEITHDAALMTTVSSGMSYAG